MDMDLVKSFIAGQVRHFATVAAGILVAYGAIEQGQSSQFVAMGSGIALWLLGAGWSWWQKLGQAQVGSLFKQVTGTQNIAAAKAAAVTTNKAGQAALNKAGQAALNKPS